MGDIYMTKETGRKLTVLILVGMGVVLLLSGVVFAQSVIGRNNLKEAEEQARATLVENQRASCERAKLDRRANAQGWRTAQAARMTAVAENLDISIFEVNQMLTEEPKLDDPFDLVAARRYDTIASSLEARSAIDCTEAFPLESEANA